MEVNLPTFGYILADSGIFRILAQLDIFMYKAYSEPTAYSSIFRTIDIFKLFQARCSGITQEQFMHIPNLIRQIQAYLQLWLIWARNVSHKFRYIHKVAFLVTLTEEYLLILGYVLVDSGIFRTLALPVQIV